MECTGILKTIVQHVLQNDLKKRKLCSCFVPPTFKTEQQWRVPYAEDLLGMIGNNPDFIDSIITDNESWCFANNPLTKQQSAAWVGPKSPHAEKLHFQKLKIKRTLIQFFDSKGVEHEELVLKGQTVTTKFYVEVLGCLLKRIAHVRLEAWKNCSFSLLYDNASVHAATTVQQFLIRKKGFQC